MKKFLSVLLACMMVLSAVATMIVSVSAVAAVAESGETPNTILVSDGTDIGPVQQNDTRPTETGWYNTKAAGSTPFSVMDIPTAADKNKTDKAAGVTLKAAENATIHQAVRFAYYSATPIDITGMKYVQFDLYIEDGSWITAANSLNVELCASNWNDEKENHFEGNYPLTEGWNTILLSLEDNVNGQAAGGLDVTKFQNLRVVINGTYTAEEDFVIAIDNFQFSNGLTDGGAEVAPHRVTLSDCDAKVDGWGWVGNGNLKATDDAANTGSVAHTLLPGAKIKGPGAIAAVYDMDDIGGETPDHLDVTGASKFIYEFYASDVSTLADIKWCIELTSGGICDSEEINWNDVTLGQFVEGGELKEGWNTIVLDLTNKSGGGYRPENWNYFRMFSNEQSEIGFPGGLTLALDNVRFEWEDGKVLTVSDCNPDKNGWGSGVNPMGVAKVTGVDEETGEDVEEIQNVMGRTYATDITATAGFNFKYANPDGSGINITGMKYLEFDFYISDADAFSNGGSLNMELSSSGTCDHSEIAYTVYTDGKSLGLKDGWNHVIIPLELFTETTNGETGPIQPTFINWFRFFNNPGTTIPVDGELTVAIDNIAFWDGKADLKTSGRGDILQARETITLATDNKTSFEFVVENKDTAKGAIFTAQLGGQVKVSVSTDGDNWSEVYAFADSKAGNGLSTAVRAFDLTEYIVDEDGLLLNDTIYVKVEGATIGDSVTVDVVYDIPEFEDTDNYTFTVGTTSEDKYLVEAGSINAEKSVRYADQNNKIVYKYELDRTQYFESMAWSAGIQGQYVISASTDGQNWTEVARWDGKEGGANGLTSSTPMLIDLSKAIDLTGTIEAVYVMITDADTSNGYGGALTNVQPTILSVKYFDAASMKHEKTSFTVTENDEAYLVQNTAGVAGGPSRFADQNFTFTYKYDVTGVDGVKSITWTAAISAQYLVKASADNENWIELGKSTESAAKATVTFDASALIDEVMKTKTLYIQVGDAVNTDGNGGRVWADTPVVLDVAYIPLTDAQKDALEMTGDEHSVPLDGCNALWSNDLYKLDFENATAGSACLSVNLKNGIVSYKKFDNPVDATGMDSLEFELYLSDLAILDDIKFGSGDSIEITCGGQPDWGEKNYDLNKIMDALKASGEAKVGWNHIVIKLADFGDTDTSGNTPWDISAINFIRVFWVSATMPADSEKYTIKFDNFRLTDAQKQAEEQKKADKEAFDANHADLVAALKALGSYNTASTITAENYEAVKAEINAVKAKVEALTEAEQKIAKDAGYIKYMEKAEDTVKKYEKKLAEIEEDLAENKELVDQINALVTEITNENYEAAKAAAEDARAKFDALDRSVKNNLTTAGVTAKLEAAEAAVAAFTPSGNQGGGNQGGGNQGGDNQGGGDDTKGGCGGVLTVGAVATMVLAGAWVTLAARKRED